VTPGETAQWHLKKEVNITHLFATVGFVISAFVYSSALDKRIQTNEQDINYLKSQRAEDIKRSEKQFDTINSKLDEVLSKVSKI
jgi:hypothetical protein